MRVGVRNKANVPGWGGGGDGLPRRVAGETPGEPGRSVCLVVECFISLKFMVYLGSFFARGKQESERLLVANGYCMPVGTARPA